jgi:hypothetical protein
LKKWRQLTDKVEPYSYRFLSHYYGTNPNIMPEYIARYIMQATLNPERYRPYYHDKNMYSHYVPSQNLPKTIVRRINGSAFLDEDYHALNQSVFQALSPYTKVILKPTLDSCNARGVMLFVRTDEGWNFVKDTSVKLTEKFLLEYSKDFIIQECIEQHERMALLNSSSVNIIRLIAYRSVKDEKSHVLGAFINVGKSGEFVCNSYYGGRLVGLDIDTGIAGGFTFNLRGECIKEWNGIDYSSLDFRVPSWHEVKQLVEEVTSNMNHMRIVMYDIAIDKIGIPKLIELHVEEPGFWIFYFSKHYALEDYMDEIIEYCKEHRAQPRSMRLVEWG